MSKKTVIHQIGRSFEWNSMAQSIESGRPINGRVSKRADLKKTGRSFEHELDRPFSILGVVYFETNDRPFNPLTLGPFTLVRKTVHIGALPDLTKSSNLCDLLSTHFKDLSILTSRTVHF